MMITIEAHDVYRLMSTGMDMGQGEKSKAKTKEQLDELKERFGEIKFYNGSLDAAIKKFGLNMYFFWFMEYDQLLLAKQYFINNKKPFFVALDECLDGDAPWLLIASNKEFKDM